MKIYVCWSTAPKFGTHAHPCGLAHEAVVEAGHDPEVVKARGWKALPQIFNNSPGRKQVKELTGKLDVPLLVLDDGSWIQGSQEIIEWAKANPAGASQAA